MPTYTYRCDEHGRFDARARMAERDEGASCPSCGSICQRVFCGQADFIIPARLHYAKAGIREVTGGHSMNDIRHDAALREKYL